MYIDNGLYKFITIAITISLKFFLQDNVHLLYQRAVAYLNVDSSIRGINDNLM